MQERLEKYLKRKNNNCSYYILCNYDEYVDNKDTIYSISNIFVINFLISLLLQDKKIKLDDKVCNYISNFKYDNVLILHLLTHSSGINNIELEYTPGGDSKYNSKNYILLKEIIENIYKDKLDILSNKYIFEPLDMKNSKYNIKDNTVSTTIEDISHYIKLILSDGYYNRKYILDKKYIDLCFTPLFIYDNDIRRTIGFSYGKSTILCNKYCSDDTIINTEDNNYNLVIDRNNELGFVILFNNNIIDKERTNINNYIYKLLMEYNKIF